MTVRQIAQTIEMAAPLRLQETYDNSGLQVGFPGSEVRKILVSLDITEEVVSQAAESGCNLVVSHHPLLFRPLRNVTGSSWQQRCVIKALEHGIALYSAHTNLDNARGGVNFRIAEKIGLENLRWLEEKPGGDAGSGLIGELPEELTDKEFLLRLKDIFGCGALLHSSVTGRKVRRIALCGGAGSFLLGNAICNQADCFITGEMHYHDFFDGEGMLLVQLGHYESEQFTVQLLRDIILGAFPEAEIEFAKTSTNPINYTK